MGGHSKRSCTSYETLPPPITPPHYHVSGNFDPNANGDYYEAGIYNGFKYYKQLNNNYVIVYSMWWSLWTIYQNLVEGNDAWLSDDAQEDPVGSYVPIGSFTGGGTVTFVP